MRNSFINPSKSSILIVFVYASLIFGACKKESSSPKPSQPDTEFPKVASDDDNMLLGNPSGAVNNQASADNYLMDKQYFALSYNQSEGKANWVSWHLTSTDIGDAARQDDFRTDNTLPASWYWVRNTSYTNSGFDRGHYCPSADRTASVTANSATFVMTNMMPQAPNNNQRTWSNLESETRRIVAAGNETYIIAGSYGSGGTGIKGGITYKIDNDRITVPSHIWKVIVVLKEGNNDLQRINTNNRVIAVSMPNTNDILSDWKTYRTTVKDIEAATGYNLFSNLSTEIQNVLETRIDNL